MFDEQPDGDPHGECAAEIHRLRDALALILPMAKGYAAAHPVGSNAAKVQSAQELLELYDADAEHLQARPLPVGWMPIETAPEEGVFLVYMPGERDKERIQVAKWHPNARVIGGCFAFDRKPPSHWMPLPASPSSAALPVGEVTQDAKARAAAYAPWFLFGAQAQELAAAIKEDGCCHHWKEVVKLLDEIAPSPEKESALPVGEGKQSGGGA